MSRAILTAAEMRAAEAAAIAAGTPAALLMERAGTAAAEAIWRFAGPLPTLILCGPGNNGGDGYVIARRLAERGSSVRIAALAEPKTPEAKAARAGWQGPMESIEEAAPAGLIVDALFGTGLARPLDGTLPQRLRDLAAAARVRVAIDLPSGVATDDGTILSPVSDFDLTVTFATLKPSHLLQPAARHMGRIAIADIGIDAMSALESVGRPCLPPPGPDDHKYRRGHVAVLSGRMPGAAALTASAAARSAGYVQLVGPAPLPNVPAAVVQVDVDVEGLLDHQGIDALVIGPGLGRGAEARDLLGRVLLSSRPLVLDADALALLVEPMLRGRLGLHRRPILTPHPGEFCRLFGLERKGSKVDETRLAAAETGAVIVHKGSDTVIADPDGRATVARPAPAWLASAGTGDVLAGIIAGMRASGLASFEAACAGVWLHGRAAELAGPALIADDLIARLPAALAECL